MACLATLFCNLGGGGVKTARQTVVLIETDEGLGGKLTSQLVRYWSLFRELEHAHGPPGRP